MMTILDQLNQDHANVARLLDLVDYQLLRSRRGDALDTSLLMNILRYMTQYQDVFHHPREDLVFARVASRSAESAAHIDELEAEHGLLASKGAGLYRELSRLADDDGDVDVGQVETHMEEYVTMLRNHMNKESSDIFPLARIILTDADWKAIDEALEMKADPLFGPAVETSYRKLLRRIGTRRDRAGGQ